MYWPKKSPSRRGRMYGMHALILSGPTISSSLLHIEFNDVDDIDECVDGCDDECDC